MKVFVRFLAIGYDLPKEYVPYELPEEPDVVRFLSALDASGREGAFCASAKWPGIPEQALVAADGRLLQETERLSEGQKISVIGQIIGG